LTLHGHYSADLLSLTTDASKLKRIMQNLIRYQGRVVAGGAFFKSAMATPERVNTICCFSLKNKKKSQRMD